MNELTSLCNKYNQELECLSGGSESDDKKKQKYIKNNISYFRMEILYMKVYITELQKRIVKKQGFDDIKWVIP